MNEFFELKTIIELEELFPKCLHYSQSTSVSMSLAINVAKKGLTKNLRCIRGMASMDFVSSPVLISQPEEKELWQSILDSCYQNNKPLITTTDQHLPLKSENPEFFDFPEFLAHLNTQSLGRAIIYQHEMPSTQDALLHNFRGVQNGIVCLTDRQVAGRGRGSNTWTGPFGCLTFSFKYSFQNGSTLPFLQYLVSVAAIHAVKHRPNMQNTNIQIKWPNDIYGDRLKIGGILCQSGYSAGSFDVTIGMGINIDNEIPTTSLNKVILNSCSDQSNPPIMTRSLFLAHFLNTFENYANQFTESGFSPFLSEYLESWMHTGQEVAVAAESEGESPTIMTIQGISATSANLTATTQDGTQVELYPDTTSLDMMASLIRAKSGGSPLILKGKGDKGSSGKLEHGKVQGKIEHGKVQGKIEHGKIEGKLEHINTECDSESKVDEPSKSQDA